MEIMGTVFGAITSLTVILSIFPKKNWVRLAIDLFGSVCFLLEWVFLAEWRSVAMCSLALVRTSVFLLRDYIPCLNSKWVLGTFVGIYGAIALSSWGSAMNVVAGFGSLAYVVGLWFPKAFKPTLTMCEAGWTFHDLAAGAYASAVGSAITLAMAIFALLRENIPAWHRKYVNWVKQDGEVSWRQAGLQVKIFCARIDRLHVH